MKIDSLVYEEGNSNLNIYFYPNEKWRIIIKGDIEERYLSSGEKKGYIKLINVESTAWNDRTMLVKISGEPVLK